MKALAVAVIVPVCALAAAPMFQSKAATVQKANGPTVGALPSAATPPPFKYYASMSDFVGERFIQSGEVVEIVSLRWGVNHDNYLMMAHVSWIDSSGDFQEYDLTGRCLTVFETLADVKDFWLLLGDGKYRMWVEEVHFATMIDGRSNIAHLVGAINDAYYDVRTCDYWPTERSAGDNESAAVGLACNDNSSYFYANGCWDYGTPQTCVNPGFKCDQTSYPTCLCNMDPLPPGGNPCVPVTSYKCYADYCPLGRNCKHPTPATPFSAECDCL